MVSKKEYTRNDVDYKTIESDLPVDAALTTGRTKSVLNGVPAIQIMGNSYKYGEQVQITVYNKIGSTKIKERVGYADKYDRMEIFIKKDEFIEMIRAFADIINQEGGDT